MKIHFRAAEALNIPTFQTAENLATSQCLL